LFVISLVIFEGVKRVGGSRKESEGVGGSRRELDESERVGVSRKESEGDIQMNKKPGGLRRRSCCQGGVIAWSKMRVSIQNNVFCFNISYTAGSEELAIFLDVAAILHNCLGRKESEGVGGRESEGVGGRREESEESVVRWSGVGVGSRESEGVGRSRRESEESEDAVNISQEWTPPPTNKNFKNLSRRKWTRSIKKCLKV